MEERILELAQAEQSLKEKWEEAVSRRILAIEKLSDLENFSFTSIKAWLKPDRADLLEAARREVREAENAVRIARWQWDNSKQELQQLQQEREDLPGQAEMEGWVQADPNLLPLYSRLESRLCLRVLPPLLEKNEAGLVEHYHFFRGGRADEILTYEEQQEIFAQPEQYGQQCAHWLRRLQKALQSLDLQLEIPAYYENPRGYVIAAAAQHNRIDRARQALDQVRAVRKRLASLEAEL